MAVKPTAILAISLVTISALILSYEHFRHLLTTRHRKKPAGHTSSSWSVLNRFVNPFVEYGDKNAANIFAYITWRLTRKCLNGAVKEVVEREMPVEEPNLKLLFEITNTRVVPSVVTQEHTKMEDSWILPDTTLPLPQKPVNVTWIGQSTLFLQLGGVNILTDPNFSERSAGWMGPKRLRPVPCGISELPKVDMVLVSHNHYDHLDIDSVTEIGNSATWYVPLGLKKWFTARGVNNAVELDWWQEHQHSPTVKIVAVPIQHWSGRGVFDVNSSLWAAFCVIEEGGDSFFHGGDSGYCTVFKEIGEKYGPFTLSALPIGSYEPRYFMHHQHMCPSEAVKVHLDLQSRWSIGVHWGTFMMSDEYFMDPPREFEKARIEAGELADGCFTTMIGETRVLA